MKDKPVILVVDDFPENIELLESHLVPEGYEIVTAEDGEAALKKIGENTVDLVLLDVMMPGMDGFEVIRRVRQDNTHRLLPIILVTSLRETEDRVKGIEAGCDDFISKPVNKMELLARVRSLLRVKAYNDDRERSKEALQKSHDELDCKVQERTAELAQANAMLQADIIELKRADEALRLANAYNRNLIEVSLDPLVTIGKDGKITDVNAATEAVTGFARSELIGSDFSSYFTEPEKASEGYEQVFRAGFVRDYPLDIKHRDGNITSVLYNASIYKDDTGKVIGVFAAARDITERKKTEDALHKSEIFVKNILETVDEGFVVVDRQYRILSANRAFCRSANLQVGQVLGRPCHEVSHHSDKPCFEDGEECPVKRTFETGAPHADSHTHVSDNGTKYHVEIKSYPVTDASGNVVSAIETITDVTEKIKLENLLLHSQKMEAVGTLAGGIAHDFNNILNVIIGYGTMVLDRMEADSLSKEQMNEVLSAADRAANLTKRLLVFSRKQVVEVKPININELILGLQKMLVRIISESIKFDLDLADRQLIVLADAGQIEQVLINLASNARDAMPEGGRLTIGTGLQELDDEYVAAYGYGKTGMYALITVADTGQGMDEETRKKIFEPFFTTKEIGEGTGLGLAISYGIIKQHTGYIKVYSEPGQGTVFKIYLPLIEESAALERKTEAPVAVKGGNETILVAEDDASLRKLSRIVLESSGYSVITAEDGEDAITKFMENRERISLVLLDMIMPKKNGKEVGETIRKVSPRTKILFASGYTMDIIKTRELTDGGFDFILKPVLSKDLLKKVREILDR